jgi:hypothetical protein
MGCRRRLLLNKAALTCLKKGRTRQGAALFSCCENDRETVITPENSTILFLSYGFSLGIMVLRGEKLKE